MALGLPYMRVDAEGHVAKRVRGRGWFGYVVRSGKGVLCRTAGWWCEKVFGNGLRQMLQSVVETERLDILNMHGNGFQIIELCNKF